MSDIKTWIERCEKHPDHQSGMISEGMIRARMCEENERLRADNERLREALEITANSARVLAAVPTAEEIDCLRAANKGLRAEVERHRADLALEGSRIVLQRGEIEKMRAENEKMRAERDALRDAAREYLTTLGGAMKAGKFQMSGSAEMAHFVRQAMQVLDSLVFDREGPRPAGLERLHEPLKRPS